MNIRPGTAGRLQNVCLMLVGGAFLTLAAGGCKRPPSVEALVSDDEGKRSEALVRLVQTEPGRSEPLVTPLVESLRDPDPRIVDRAVDALVIIGEPAVPTLARSMGADDPFARLSAARALALIGPASTAALPELLVLLHDPHPLVRDEAAAAIGALGTRAEPAVPHLADLLYDPQPDVRDRARGALKKIGSEAAKTALEDASSGPKRS